MNNDAFITNSSGTADRLVHWLIDSVQARPAAQRLHGGETVERTAGHVGYSSSAAFSRAFHKVMGEHPGSFRRARRPAPVPTPATPPMQPMRPTRTIEQKTRTDVSDRVAQSPVK